MSKLWIVVLALAGSLTIPAVVGAHEHDKTVMGTVSSIDRTNLMVKTVDGKTVMVMMDAKTKITQGKTTLDAKALKVGQRIAASGPLEKNMLTAETVKIGEASAPAKAAKK